VARSGSAQKNREARTGGKAAPPRPARGAVSALELDRVIHERIRLGIVSALAVFSTSSVPIGMRLG